MSQLTVTEKLFGTTTLSEQKATLVKKTYAFLAITLVFAIGGAVLASHEASPMTVFMLDVMGSRWGWLAALVLINVVPQVALWVSRRSPALGVVMLALDGLISGLVIGPLVLVATYISETSGGLQHLPLIALGITLAIFGGITAYVLLAKKQFSAPRGLLIGLLVSILVGSTLNLILGFSGLAFLVSMGIGLLGCLMLIYATSDVINNPDFTNPVLGAVMLFAALFNIFVSALRLLTRFSRN